MNRLKFVAVMTSVCIGVALSGATSAAEQPSGPTVSHSVAKQLKAAGDAVVAKHYDAALEKLREAQAASSGEKTSYDNYLIDTILIQIYQGKNDVAELVQTLGRATQSQYATGDQQKTWYKFIAQYYYQQKDYSKSLGAAEHAMHRGATDSDTMGLIAKAQYLSGKYKDAEQTQADIVGKQEKPDEDSLKLMWQFALKAQDDAAAAVALEKLVALYPKPKVLSDCGQLSAGTTIYAASRTDTVDPFSCCAKAVTVDSVSDSIWRSKLSSGTLATRMDCLSW